MNQETRRESEPSPIRLDWYKEYKREDLEKIEELVSKDSKLEDLNILTERPFVLTPKDVLTINSIGHNHRCVGPESRELKSKDFGYDYSVESRFFMSFIFHKMKEAGVSEDFLKAFKDLIDFREKQYINAPNKSDAINKETGKTWEADNEEKFHELMALAEKTGDRIIFEKIVIWASKYFDLMDRMCYVKDGARPRWGNYDEVLGNRIPEYEHGDRLGHGKNMDDYHAYQAAMNFLTISMGKVGFYK